MGELQYRDAWYHCPKCLLAWRERVPVVCTEEEYINLSGLVCRFGCFDYKPNATFKEAIRYMAAVRVPYAVREALEAAFLLGGTEATREVIKGWHAQVFGEPSCG